ncbi:MAG: hypothetical protein KDK07_08025 [Bauldia sp.]|nr:hypothetical protein [Bauldia sp.]
MTALDPTLVDHALKLAEAEWGRARPAAAASPVPAIAEETAGLDRAWYVVQTRSRAEGDARDGLAWLGYQTFLPTLRREVRGRQPRTRIVREFPLFNRYLFAELPRSPQHWGGLRAIEEIERVLGGDGGVPVREAEVRRFMSAQEEGRFDETKAAQARRERERRRSAGRGRAAEAVLRFPIGARVRALRGPFGGFSGHVSDITGRGVVKAMLAMFGGLTPVDFTIEDIELLAS